MAIQPVILPALDVTTPTVTNAVTVTVIPALLASGRIAWLQWCRQHPYQCPSGFIQQASKLSMLTVQPYPGALYYHAIAPSSQVATTTTAVAWYTAYAQEAFGNQIARAYAMEPSELRVVARRRLIDGRKALRRSIELFASVRGDDEIMRFLRGETLRVRGNRFDYDIAKRGNVLLRGAHRIELWAVAKPDLFGAQRRLSSGCVHLDDAPPVDQLLAMILHVEDADGENDFIRRTNWTPALPRERADEPRQRLAA